MASPDEPRVASKVFAIPELLENILIYTDTLQLFVLQSVNSTFQDTMRGSKEIRRRMCLEPKPEWRSITRLDDLLDDIRAKGVMEPLEVVRLSGQRFHIKVQCGHGTKYDCEKKPPTSLISALSTGSWRQIKIYDPTAGEMKQRWGEERPVWVPSRVTLRLSCDCRRNKSGRRRPHPIETLGELVDAALASLEVDARVRIV